MKVFKFTLLLLTVSIIAGCTTKNNFMDIDNSNAKEDLKNLIGNGEIPTIDTNNLIPNELSGARNDAKGYANQYYEDNLKGYVNTAKEGLSGAVQELKGQYNNKVDELNDTITNKVNGTISGEMIKLKIK